MTEERYIELFVAAHYGGKDSISLPITDEDWNEYLRISDYSDRDPGYTRHKHIYMAAIDSDHSWIDPSLNTEELALYSRIEADMRAESIKATKEGRSIVWDIPFD